MGALDALSSNQQLEAVYIGYFGRAADGPGFAFWQQQFAADLASGQSPSIALNNIANAFAPQKETTALYPLLPGNHTLSLTSYGDQVAVGNFITNAYQNLFGHAPDATGYSYWRDQILSGNVSLGSAILAIANGATNSDAIDLQNRAIVALDFTTRTAAANLGLTTPLAANYLAVAHVILVGVDGAGLNDGSVAYGEYLTTNFIHPPVAGGGPGPGPGPGL